MIHQFYALSPFDRIPLEDVLGLDAKQLAEHCEWFPLADFVSDVEYYEPGGLASRRDICEFLDIGESTLSGWLKQERVPRMALLAMTALAVIERLDNIRMRQPRRQIHLAAKTKQGAGCFRQLRRKHL